MRRALLIATVCLFGVTADATVTTSTSSVSYVGSSNTSFTVTFAFTAASQITVRKTLIATGVDVTPFTQGIDYTVRLPVGSTQGVVTTAAAVTSSYRITITRNVPYTQTTSFSGQGSYSASAHEAAFDKLTMEVQQVVAANGGVTQADIDTAVANHAAAADPHTGYAKLAGRAGGQTLIGGTAASNNLVLQTSSNGTKGKILMGSAGTELVVDDVNNRVGIGTASPSVALHAVGELLVDGTNDLKLTGDCLGGVTGCLYQAGSAGLTVGAYDVGITSGGELLLYPLGHATRPNEARLRGSTITLTDFADVAYGTFTSGLLTLPSTLQSPTIRGGTGVSGNLTILTTSNATKGKVLVGSAGTELVVDDANDRVGIGTATPTYTLSVSGEVAGLRPYGLSGATTTLSNPTHCNAVVVGNAANAVVVLPALTKGESCQITVINNNAAGSCVQLEPNAGSGDFISGTIVGVTLAGGVGIRIANTAATAVHNDYVTVVSVAANEWAIIGGVGVWKAAACP